MSSLSEVISKTPYEYILDYLNSVPYLMDDESILATLKVVDDKTFQGYILSIISKAAFKNCNNTVKYLLQYYQEEIMEARITLLLLGCYSDVDLLEYIINYVNIYSDDAYTMLTNIYKNIVFNIPCPFDDGTYGFKLKEDKLDFLAKRSDFRELLQKDNHLIFSRIMDRFRESEVSIPPSIVHKLVETSDVILEDIISENIDYVKGKISQYRKKKPSVIYFNRNR